MGTGSTRAWEHGHRINMGTRSTWALDQHRDGNMGMGLKHAAIIFQPGVRGRSPWQVGDPVPTQAWEHAQDSTMQQLLDSQGSGGGAPGKLETQCCRNGVSEAHLRAEGTGHKLV